MHLCFLSSFNKHFTTDLPSSLPKVISPKVMLPKFAVVLPEIHGHDSKKCQWVKSIVRVKCETQVVHFPVDWYQKDCNPKIKHGNEKKLVIWVSVWFSLSLFYMSKHSVLKERPQKSSLRLEHWKCHHLVYSMSSDKKSWLQSKTATLR